MERSRLKRVPRYKKIPLPTCPGCRRPMTLRPSCRVWPITNKYDKYHVVPYCERCRRTSGNPHSYPEDFTTPNKEQQP